MGAAARQLRLAGLQRGLVLRVVLRLLVADAAERPVGARVGEVGQTVGAHALRELARLRDKGWGPAVLLVFAAGGQIAALLLRGLVLRVVLRLLVAGAAERPVGSRVGEVGQTDGAHALRVCERGLLRVCAGGRPVA